MSKDRVCVGAIAGAFGVRGEVRLKSFCAEAEAIAGYAPLFTEDGARRFDVILRGTIPNGLAARLTGIGTREEAEALRGWISERQAELALLPAPETATTDNPSRPPAGLGALEAGLIDAGLRQSLVTLTNPSGASVSLRFDGVGFAQLMPWLDGLERGMGYRLASLRLTRTDAPGLVDADIQLEPMP